MARLRRSFRLIPIVVLACITCTPPADAQPSYYDAGVSACVPPHDKYKFCDTSLSIEDRVWDLVKRVPNSSKANLLTARGKGGHKGREALPELGVPSYYWGSNCIHSSMFANCTSSGRCSTSFPSGPNQAATFDRELLRELAVVVGRETRAGFNLGNFTDNGFNGLGLDCWGPVINMNRDPRWGRNAEGGTEDPYLMGQLGKAWTEGLQKGDGSETRFVQVAVTLKHYDANSVDGGSPSDKGFTRNTVSANVTKYDLQDFYWPAFRTAISEADAKGVMCSYNAVNMVPTCADPLMRRARELWNFTGYVTSDSDAVGDIWRSHHYKATAAAASCVAVSEGGCDIDSGNTYNDGLMEGVAQNLCDISSVDQALFNTFRVRFELGLFDPIEDQPLWKLGEQDIGTDAAKALNLEIAASSLVLLQNEGGVLPFKKGSRIAVIGPHGNATEEMIQTDTGKVCPHDQAVHNHDFHFDCVRSPAEWLSKINGLPVTYAPGCHLIHNSTAGFGEAVEAAKDAEYVVMGLGITQRGELWDPTHDRHVQDYFNSFVEREAHDRESIDLPEVQKALAREVIALGKPTVVFLLHGGMVGLEEFVGKPNVAIIEAFYPGMEGGRALAQSVFGDTNHWGKLPYTVYSKDWTRQNSMLEHDIVRGKRTYRYGPTDVVAPFGRGLSLASFKLTGLKAGTLSAATGSDTFMSISLTVSNAGTGETSGGMTGDEVVMAYMEPQGISLATHPVKSLFDFTRVKDLQPGHSAQVSFSFTSKNFLIPNDAGDLVSSPGLYTLAFENGAGERLEAQLRLTGQEVVVEKFPAL